MTKVCPRCVKEKPVGEFHLQRDRHKRQGYCKECSHLQNHNYREKRTRNTIEQKIISDRERYALLDETRRPKAKICSEHDCAYAGKTQPPEYFDASPISSDGLSLRCRGCELLRKQSQTPAEKSKEYHRVWYEQNRHILNERTKQWREANPEEVRKLHVRRRFRQYSADQAWYDNTLAEQGGGCAICGSKDAKNQWNTFHIDHDHRCCKKPCHACDKCRRGLLCSVCNVHVGILEKDDWVWRAQKYLRAHRKQPA